MAESKFGAAAFSQGDVMRRMRRLEAEVAQLRTNRNLEAALIGSGGLRILGGLLRVQDIDGDDMFRAGGDPGEVFIRDDILRPLVRTIFGEGVFGDTVFGTDPLADTDSGNTWVDLDQVGPTVSGVEVSEAGRALVFHGARFRNLLHSDDAQIVRGRMSFEITGATERDPAVLDTRVAELGGVVQTVDTDAITTEHDGSAMTVSLIGENTSLNPGEHTFQAKYAAIVAPNTTEERVEIGNRFLIVIPF